jgi:hypothetical protein
VYSASGMASLRNAFSSSSNVTIILKSSARDSWRSRSARVLVSLTSYTRLAAVDGDFDVSYLIEVNGRRKARVRNIAMRSRRIALSRDHDERGIDFFNPNAVATWKLEVGWLRRDAAEWLHRLLFLVAACYR